MSDEEEYPKKCWVVKYGRRIEEKIPDDNSVDSAVSVMVFTENPWETNGVKDTAFARVFNTSWHGAYNVERKHN